MTQEDKDIIEETKQEKPKRMKSEKKEEDKNILEAENNNEEKKAEYQKEESVEKKEIREEDKQKAEKKAEEKKKIDKKPKKDEASVRSRSLAISTKHSIALCKFIRGKSIEKAISDIGAVLNMKIAVPMKGEIPHRRGDIMSGRYPKNASHAFLALLKNLAANARQHGVDESLPITLAKADIAPRPYGRFGRYRRKRTHVEIKIAVPKKQTSLMEKMR